MTANDANNKPSDAEATSIVSAGSNHWSAFMLSIYKERRPPALSTVEVKRIEELAREKLKDHMDAYLYVFGSAGTCSTERFNREAFDTWRIVPRMLHDATSRDIGTTIFGTKLNSPLLIAPIGVHGIVHPEAELATARAAASLGVPMIMSTASTRSIEAVAAASGPGSPRWFQLYWPKTPEITLSVLARAKKEGFTALVVTLDTATLGWRPHDLDRTYLPFLHSTGSAVGLSDPVFMRRMGQEIWPADKHVEFPYDPAALEARAAQGDVEVQTRKTLGTAWLAETNSGLYKTWEELALLKENWEGPIVLKGIQSVEDAETAVDWVDGIIVSNHGGRQIDGATASLDALDAICLSEKVRAAQAAGTFTVLFDSGIRTGSDIIKALALGAQGVLLGRPFMYGLCLAGEKGVAEQVRSILADLEITLGLSGYSDIKSVQGKRSALVKVTAARS
ncbi:FMN-dependent alpha-hydroxy acid dehydrogenase [Phellopilus nigrolimitatus]|nr:FMN-dependent alpha-hydroxy acid dehydrogenase [Phellopilus nigrolimitatus]